MKYLFVFFVLFLGTKASAMNGACVLPPNIKTGQEAARHYIKKGDEEKDEDKAVQYYSKSVECDPLFRSAPWIALANHHLKNNSLRAVEYFLRRASLLSPRSKKVLLLKAQLASVRGNYRKAFAICSNLMRDKASREILECVAQNGLNIQEIKRAREALLALEKIRLDEPRAPISVLQFELGKAFEMGLDKIRYGRGADLDRAIEHFKAAFNHPKRFIWSSFHLALIYAEKKNYEEALLWNDKFLLDYPSLDVALYNKACFLARLERHEEALTWLKQAVDLGFRDKKHIANDGDLKGLRGKPEFQALLNSLPNLHQVVRR